MIALVIIAVVFCLLTGACFGLALAWSDPILFVFSLFLAVATVGFTMIILEEKAQRDVHSVEECLEEGGTPKAETKYVNGQWVSQYDWCDL